MKRLFQRVLLGLAAACLGSFALAAELSGTPEELRGYLQSETRTVTFNYSDVHAVDNSRFGALEEIIVTGSRSKLSNMSVAAAPPPSNFDEIEYRVSVAVTFSIEQDRPN